MIASLPLRFLPSLLLCGLCLAWGCAPAPVYRLEPLDEAPSRWQYGREYVLMTDAGLDVEAAYAWTAPEGHVLDVAVYNRADTTVLVDPAAFYAVAQSCRGGAGPTDTLRALDPEQRLLEIEQAAARAEAAGATATALGIALFAVDLVATLTSDEPVEAAYSFGWEDEDESAPPTDPALERWEQTTLRKTTLAPGYDMRGHVYFPLRGRAAKASCLVAHFPIGPFEMRFAFAQRRY